jgi:hypothetical protein
MSLCRRISLNHSETFPYMSRLAMGPPVLLYDGYQVPFPGLKQLVCGVHHASTCSAEVKERVQLHLSGPLWSVTGRTSPFNPAPHPKKKN